MAMYNAIFLVFLFASRSLMNPFVERLFGWTCELPKPLNNCHNTVAETDLVPCSSSGSHVLMKILKIYVKMDS